MKSGKLLLGLIAGVAAGAVIGILFAPDKGSVTRRKMTEKGAELADDLKEKFNEFIEEISGKFDSIINEAHMVYDGEELASDGRAKAEQGQNDSENKMN